MAEFKGYGLAALALALSASVAAAQGIPEVPRNRTLISQGWDAHNQVPSPTNFNPYAGVLLHQRNSLHYTVNEMLFYTNHYTNTLVPWMAEKYAYNPDFTEITITLRPDVLWSDGKPFTAEDVAFTFAMLKGAAPDLLFSSAIAEWVKSADVVDPRTVKVVLNKPGPRWAADFLATGQSTRFVVVPKHVWEGKDPKTFANFDLAAGWPVGTGPYRLVKSDASSLVYDLRDKWWAADAKLSPMPAVRRVIYVPATLESMPQLYASNQVDMGRNIPSGAFEAVRALNPRLTAWNAQGPVWGAPNGCVFAIRFNTQKAPFDDPALRRAINAAVNRDQVVNLAYEGSITKAVVPFSSYEGMRKYGPAIDPAVKDLGLDGGGAARVAQAAQAAKLVRAANGRWARADGAALQVQLQVQQGDPIGPVLAQQLRAAGFDAVFSPMQGTALTEAMIAGNYEMTVGPHCGSLYDPWQTLEHFHSKYAAEPGQGVKNLRAPTRYKNPELDALLDRMERMQPSPTDPAYLDLVRQAVAIYARDLPEVVLAEEVQTQPFNTTYWTGFPSAADAYVAPPLPWEGFALVIHRLKPRQ